MKTLFLTTSFIAVLLFCSGRPQLYTRELKEKHTADSLRVVDSLHIADSIRIADSCMLARYHIADSIRVEERKIKQQTSNDKPATDITVPLPSPGFVHDDEDIASARTVVIDSGTPFAYRIDSLEKEHNRINDMMHDHDDYFKQMKKFHVSEKKRYIHYLLKNHLKDTVEVVAYCNDLKKLYALKYELLCAIQQSQEGNTRTFMQAHIENHKQKMVECTELLLSFTPDLSTLPEHVTEQYSKY